MAMNTIYDDNIQGASISETIIQILVLLTKVQHNNYHNET